MKVKIICPLTALLFFFLASCQTYTENHIELTPEKHGSSVHVGQGVWMKIPSGYERASSYEGFQTPGMNSSISVKTSLSSIGELKKSFEPQNLKKLGIELMELSTVEYGDNDNAFFSMVHDKRRRTVKYLLAINEGGRTYNIKAFCFYSAMNRFDPVIRESLFSAFIGEHIEKEELFQLAAIENAEKFYYTRDGNLPTEAEDGAVVEMETLGSLSGISGPGLIESELQQLVPGKAVSVGTEFLSNGKFYFGTSISDDKVAFVALTALTGEEEGALVRAYARERSALADIEEFVRGQFLKAGVRGY